MSNVIYEGQVMSEDEYFTMQNRKNPPNCDSGIQKPSPSALNKEEVIVKLVESLNIGGEEADCKRVDIAFMQYEQIQKKLNAWKEF